MSDTVRVKLRQDAFMPERAHATDAGADIKTPEGFTLRAHSSEIVATGVHIELPHGKAGVIKSKSGLNIRYGIISDGLIDEGYDGEIMVKLYNLSDYDKHFNRGDKITQLVITDVMYAEFEQADEIAAGERGSDGFGSTGH